MIATFNNISDELKALLTPLKSGETATYRLLTKQSFATEELPDGRTVNRLLAPPNAIFSAQATIYDPGKNEMVEIMAQAGTRRGKDGLEPVEDTIQFKAGLLVVRHNQPDLYRFLELHPANADSVLPGNRPVNGYQFERVQPEKDSKTQAQSKRQSIKALNELDTFSYDELKRAALRLKLDASLDKDSLFVALSELAQADGERVYNAIGDRAIQIESLAGTAISEGILEWDGSERVWKLRESQRVFLSIPHGAQEEELVVELTQPRFQKQRAMLEKLVAEKQKATASKKK